jgi:hypothetical protein
MFGAGVTLIVDVLIMVLLALTVLFAARLTSGLKRFRESRGELEELIKNLSSVIEHAENSVAALREAAKQSGRDLQARINEAASLADELQIMTESGGNMAGRLEQIAERNIRFSRRMDKKRVTEEEVALAPVTRQSKHSEKHDDYDSFSDYNDAGFSINDSDMDMDLDADVFGGFDEDDDFSSSEFDDNEEKNILYSRAERELYDALHGGDN